MWPLQSEKVMGTPPNASTRSATARATCPEPVINTRFPANESRLSRSMRSAKCAIPKPWTWFKKQR